MFHNAIRNKTTDRPGFLQGSEAVLIPLLMLSELDDDELAVRI